MDYTKQGNIYKPVYYKDLDKLKQVKIDIFDIAFRSFQNNEIPLETIEKRVHETFEFINRGE